MTAKIIISITEGESSAEFDTTMELKVEGASFTEGMLAKRIFDVYEGNLGMAIQCAMQSMINEIAAERGIPAPKVGNSVTYVKEQTNEQD